MAISRSYRKHNPALAKGGVVGLALFLLALALAMGEAAIMRADPAAASFLARAIHASHAGSPILHAAAGRQHAHGEHSHGEHTHAQHMHGQAALAPDAGAGVCAECAEGPEPVSLPHHAGPCCPLACAGLVPCPSATASPVRVQATLAPTGLILPGPGRTLEPPTPPPRLA